MGSDRRCRERRPPAVIGRGSLRSFGCGQWRRCGDPCFLACGRAQIPSSLEYAWAMRTRLPSCIAIVLHHIGHGLRCKDGRRGWREAGKAPAPSAILGLRHQSGSDSAVGGQAVLRNPTDAGLPVIFAATSERAGRHPRSLCATPKRHGGAVRRSDSVAANSRAAGARRNAAPTVACLLPHHRHVGESTWHLPMC
jgi:hypothetical protein